MSDTTRHAPTSTYRVQLSAAFTLADAERVVPYLDALGIGAVYLSPCLRSMPGSPHGYDIVDHNTVDPELGGQAAFESLARAVSGRGMGLVVDFVPNHMAADASANRWWAEVLENGTCSPHADYFAIDWHPLKPEIEGRLLVPILGDQYGAVLERGELRLIYDDGRLFLKYFDHQLPITPRSAPLVLRAGLDALTNDAGHDSADLRELLSILTGLDHLPPYTETDPERIEERSREKEVLRERLARLARRSPEIRHHIDRALAIANGTVGVPSSFDLLHDLLEHQVYRLAYWRTASHEINYRRFFDINELAGLRVERPEVFAATHGWLTAMVERGLVTGIRIDHPDGLFDPEQYFERLRALAPGRWIVVEKILTGAEELRETWPVDGTTGYGFLTRLNGLFVSADGARELVRIYRRFTALVEPFEEIVYESKTLIMDTAMSSELNVLADALNRLSELDRRSRDFTLNALRDALAQVVAAFPVYRTYVSDRGWTDEDCRIIELAIRRARVRNPAMEASIFSFVEDVVLPQGLGEKGDGMESPALDRATRERVEIAMKLQQYTAPVEAKGFEDTAFYRYIPLLSLNEVGGGPGRPAGDPSAFHEANSRRHDRWPLDMLATSTHDTKLGEDTRIRIDALTHVPARWRQAVFRWARATAGALTELDGESAPDRNDVYRLFQALVGCWPWDWAVADAVPPEFTARLVDYMTKAAREAKLHTSWINQNGPYEAAIRRFVERILSGPESRRFVPLLVEMVQAIAPIAMTSSLAQLVLKLTAPGVPDFYQGTELWTLTLVDPDNRRQIAYDERARLLADVEPLLPPIPAAAGRPASAGHIDRLSALCRSWQDGRIKLLVTAAGLRLRRAFPDLFHHGEYQPLDVDHANFGGQLIAFARTHGSHHVLVAAPWRLGGVDPLAADAWGTARLAVPETMASRQFVNVITGTRISPSRDDRGAWIPIAGAFGVLPVGLLLAE